MTNVFTTLKNRMRKEQLFHDESKSKASRGQVESKSSVEHSPLARLLPNMTRSAAMLLCVLVLGVGEMWGASTTIFSLSVSDSGSDVTVNRQGGDVSLTTSNHLSSLSGGTANLHNYTSSSGSGHKMIGSDKVNNVTERHIRFAAADNALVLVLSNALAQGDTIVFTNNSTVQLSITGTTTRATATDSLTTSNKYIITQNHKLIGATTIYLWRAGGSNAFIKTLSIKRPSGGGGGGGDECSSPSFTTQPTSADYAVGASATSLTATATATNPGTITYKWQKSTNYGSTYSDIDGATNQTYSPSTATTGITYYRSVAIFSGGCSNTNSNAAIIAVSGSNSGTMSGSDYILYKNKTGSNTATSATTNNSTALTSLSGQLTGDGSGAKTAKVTASTGQTYSFTVASGYTFDPTYIGFKGSYVGSGTGPQQMTFTYTLKNSSSETLCSGTFVQATNANSAPLDSIYKGSIDISPLEAGTYTLVITGSQDKNVANNFRLGDWVQIKGTVEEEVSGYSITYECNSATSGCPSNANGQTALPNPLPSAPTKTGYTFNGWYTDEDFDDAAVAGATLSADATLYAKWLANPTSLTNGTTTYNSQEVSWTPGDEEYLWELFVSTSSSTPADDEESTIITTMNSFTFEELEETTTYYWWVRSIYNYEETTAWVAGTSFTTKEANDYTYTGADNSWGTTDMIVSESGFYEYYQTTTDNHQFKIKKGSTYYNKDYNKAGFCMTDISSVGDYGGDNCYIWDAPESYYIIVFKPETDLNSSSSPVICASTTLPDDTDAGLAETKRIFLIPNSNWTQSDAKFAVKYTGHDGEYSDYMTELTCESGHWYVDIPALYSDIQFCRMNPESTRDDDGLWNYSSTLRLSASNNCYTIASGAWSDAGTTGSSYAVPTYTITYNANKGSGSMSNETGIACNGSQTLTTNTFTRTGWTFTGWNTDPYGDGTPYSNGATVSGITANITLYAQWERTIYLRAENSEWWSASAKLTIHYWDGDATSNNGDVVMERADECSDPRVYKATISGGGYNKLLFYRLNPANDAVWTQTVDLDFNDTYDMYNLTNMNGGTDNKAYGTFSSSYSAPTYTISFAAGGGSGSMSAIDDIACKGNQTIPANGFTRSGYTFANWVADVDVTVSSATVDAGDPIADEATIQAISSDITLTAQWSEDTHTVTVAYKCGETTLKESDEVSGVGITTAAEITAPSITGYTFSTWSAMPSGVTTEDALTGSTININATADSKTITANYTANEYTISYKDEGNETYSGSNGASLPTTHTYGTATALVDGVKEGYTFVGWYFDEDCESSAGSSIGATSKTAGFTLYAKWTIKTYAITYNAGANGTGSIDAGEKTHGVSFTLSSSTFTRDGYVQDGWATSDGGDKAYDLGGSYTANAAISLYPHWVVDCPSSDSGETVYKFVTKSSGLGTGNVCATASTNYDLTTGEGKPLETLTGGTLTAYTTNTSNLKYATNAISWQNGTAGQLILNLNCALATGDVIRFISYSASSGKYNYLRHTSSSTTSGQIQLDASQTAGIIQQVVVPAAFNGKDVLYIVAGSYVTNISSVEIIRPYVVTLDANTNGGKVNGNNKDTVYYAQSESKLLPHAFKSNNYFNGWFAESSGGDAVSNPYTATSTQTLYAQWNDCPSSGTIYKFQVASGLTNGNIGTTTPKEYSTSDYLSVLTGGTLAGYASRVDYLQISGTNSFSFHNNGTYLKVDLDCPLQTGDTIKSTTANKKFVLNNTASSSGAIDITLGENQVTLVPAGLNGSSTLYIYRSGSNTPVPNISYFEIIRPTKYTITYNAGANGTGSIDAGTKIHNADYTISSSTFTRTGYTQDGWATSDGGDKAYDFGETYTTNADLTLYPHWCHYKFAPTLTSGSLAAGDTVLTSAGGTMVTTNTGAEYETNGLKFGAGAEVKVTLDRMLQAGSVIKFVFYHTNDATARGPKLADKDGNVVDSYTTSAVGTYTHTYTVVADDGLDGTNAFLIQRNNNFHLKSLNVYNCGALARTVTYHSPNDDDYVIDAIADGSDIDDTYLPTACAAADRVFVGWAASEVATQQTAPTIVSRDGTLEDVTANMDLYAVFACKNGGKVNGETHTLTEDFESYSTSTTYTNTGLTFDNANGLSWQIDYGNVTGTGKGRFGESNTKDVLLSVNANEANQLVTRAAVKDVVGISVLAGKKTAKLKGVMYWGTNGSTWPNNKDLVISTTSNSYKTTQSFDAPQDIYLKFQSEAVTTLGSDDQLYLDSIVFTIADRAYYLTDYSSTCSKAASATVTWVGGDGAVFDTPAAPAVGEWITFPEPIRLGYTFNGWKATIEGDVKSHTYNAGEVFLVNHSVTFTAQWTSHETNFKPDGDGLWSNPENWSAGLPTISDIVYLVEPVTVDIDDAVAGQVILDQSSDLTGALIIQPGKALTVATTVKKTTDYGETLLATEAADILIQSNAANGNGALVMGSYDGTNAATVQFYTKAGKNAKGEWVNQIIGTPFNNEYYIKNNYLGTQMYAFDAEEGEWITPRMANDDDMTPFIGYNLLSSQSSGIDLEMTGTLNASAEQNISLTNSSSAAKENILANSWVAPIDISGFEDDDFVNVTKTIYIFNAGSPEDFDANGEGDIGAAADANTLPGQYTSIPIHLSPFYTNYKTIPSMQGFSVMTTASASSASLRLNYANLVYNPAKKAITMEKNHMRRRTIAADESPEIIKLFVRGNSGYRDELWMVVRDDFSEGFDDGWEAQKMLGYDEAPQLYAVSEAGQMSVDAVSDVEGVVLGFKAGELDQNYTFTFEYDGEDELYLYDRDSLSYHLVETGQSYTFGVNDVGAHNRFVLTRYRSPQTPTGIEPTPDPSLKGRENAHKFMEDQKIFILYRGVLYDGMGKRVEERRAQQ